MRLVEMLNLYHAYHGNLFQNELGNFVALLDLKFPVRIQVENYNSHRSPVASIDNTRAHIDSLLDGQTRSGSDSTIGSSGTGDAQIGVDNGPTTWWNGGRFAS